MSAGQISVRDYPVLPYVGAFAFVRDADKPSNVNNQDNHSQFFSVHSIHKSKRKLFSHKITECDPDEL
jgi:hypothetical protein